MNEQVRRSSHLWPEQTIAFELDDRSQGHVIPQQGSLDTP